MIYDLWLSLSFQKSDYNADKNTKKISVLSWMELWTCEQNHGNQGNDNKRLT